MSCPHDAILKTKVGHVCLRCRQPVVRRYVNSDNPHYPVNTLKLAWITEEENKEE